jgi:hypothetical protein
MVEGGRTQAPKQGGRAAVHVPFACQEFRLSHVTKRAPFSISQPNSFRNMRPLVL